MVSEVPKIRRVTINSSLTHTTIISIVQNCFQQILEQENK